LRLRRASSADLALLVGQGGDFFADAHPAVPRPTPERFARFISEILGRAVVAILEDDTGYVGSVALELAAWDWSDDLVLRDRWLHVRADRRRSSAALTLTRFGLALAQRRGVPLYLASSIPRRTPARPARLIGR
jgi:hypothetical protein